MTKRLSCWLFGHAYRLATQGLTGVASKPVFRCDCGAEWITARGWGRNRPTRRDRFAPFP